MAVDEVENEEDDLAPPGLSKLKLAGIAGAVVLLVVLSIAATLFFLGVFDSEPGTASETTTDTVAEENQPKETEADETDAEEVAAEPEAQAAQAAQAAKAPAMYFPIQPAFVVNFQARGRTRYLQVDVTIMTRNPMVFDAIQMNLPLIKNRLVMLFGSGIYEELQTDEGKELMRQQALESLQKLMQQEIGTSEIEQVLFTNFVMQ